MIRDNGWDCASCCELSRVRESVCENNQSVMHAWLAVLGTGREARRVGFVLGRVECGGRCPPVCIVRSNGTLRCGNTTRYQYHGRDGLQSEQRQTATQTTHSSA